MKRNAIARIIIWSVTAFILIGVLSSAIIFKNNWLSQLTNKGISFGTMGSKYLDSEKYTVGGGSVVDDVDSLEINWVDGKINVEAYDGDTVEISETSVKDSDDELRYYCNNGKLIIQYRVSGVSFGVTKSLKKELTVKIPASAAAGLNELKIDSSSADISVSGMSFTKQLELDNVSGSIRLSNVKAAKTDIDNVSGRIKAEYFVTDSLSVDTISGDAEFKGEIGKIESDSVSGELKVESAIMPISADCESVSGNISFKLPDEGITLEFDSVSGDISGNVGFVKKGEKRFYRNGGAEFIIDTTSGDFNIEI